MHEQEDSSAEYGHFYTHFGKKKKKKKGKTVKEHDHLLQNAESDPAKL